jgi:hypothetical protein
VKNYFYRDDSEGVAGARVEAFANWKAMYNLSMCMTYGGFWFPVPFLLYSVMGWGLMVVVVNSIVHWGSVGDVFYPE